MPTDNQVTVAIQVLNLSLAGSSNLSPELVTSATNVLLAYLKLV